MKKGVLLLLSILSLMSCKKDNSITNCTQGAQAFSKDSITLDVTEQHWYLTKIGNGGNISLKMKGSTNGDSAKIRTYGYGLISDLKIALDASKKFESDNTISISATAPKGDIIEHSIIYVYKNSDTLIAKLASCTLRY